MQYLEILFDSSWIYYIFFLYVDPKHFIIDFFELLNFIHHFDNSQDSNFALYNNKKILQIIYS
jgi:hypothetical protein